MTTLLVVISLASSTQVAYGAENTLGSEIKVIGRTSPGQTVTVSGLDVSQVDAVEIDSKPASFEMLEGGSLSVQIPLLVQPGDVTLRLKGDFGTEEFSNLFEVLPLALDDQPKVTIGSFQGYVAVYTKNFKGFSMRIKIGNRERVIPVLEDNFTKNLTKVKVGKTHEVAVFLNDEVVQLGRIAVR